MKKDSFQFDCTYGRSKTRDTGYYYNGWYCVDGSININYTYDDVSNGTDVEELRDNDTMTWSSPINSLEELINAVES
jgi:hypothetical protein